MILGFGDSNHPGESCRLLGQAIQASAEHGYITGIKKALRNDDMILRVLETDGIGGTICFPKENKTYGLRPYEIKTLRKAADSMTECNLIEKDI